ncbi:DNA-binding response OmpR family regulator [Oceanisphaera litoralis]|uniref:response regulator n=1 Tax=Oceanisphaera litoralis TaxID=225144 RepID=UPI0019566028|nr:response regulator [Oceanisphaera litoralis]MBM7455963.1 DNA-binding response OmpR family regulator [Oceanisphaera litoralis]
MNYKVLIVEDELILAQNLKLYLEFQQLEVQVVSNGASAISLVQNDFTPDIIVLDFRLPDMAGLLALDTIHQYWNGHCVLMTGNPINDVREQAVQRGISYILFKPFPLAELARAIRALRDVSQSNHCDVGSLEKREDRRSRQRSDFPLQMYDGTWVYAERRQSEQADIPDIISSKDESTEDNGRT